MKIAMMTEIPLRYMSQADAIRWIKKQGFDGVDITLLNAMNDADEMMKGDYRSHAKALGDLCRKLAIAPVQAHAPFPIHKDGNEAYDRKMVEVTIKCLEICSLIGVPVCVIHPWNHWSVEENKTLWFDRLLPAARSYRVRIATENMWNWDKASDRAAPAACSSPESFLALCQAMADPYFGACVDVGHANMFPFEKGVTPDRMIEVLGSRYVFGLHLHDNDGWHDLHRAPKAEGGTVPWAKILSALRTIGYQGDLVAETQQPFSATLADAAHLAQEQKTALEGFRSALSAK
jgi:sugar phosphate isomerase/epimerase